jgi:hypothetical protein
MSPKLAVLFFAAALFPETNDIEKAVLDVNAQMTRAAEAHDIDSLFTYMLPNDRGSIAQSGYLFLTREDAHASVKRSFAAIPKIAYRWNHQFVTVLAPDAALLVADGESEVTLADGTRAVTPFTQTVVFLRKSGEWKALHAHQSTLPRR